jgi:hypothetical protein
MLRARLDAFFDNPTLPDPTDQVSTAVAQLVMLRVAERPTTKMSIFIDVGVQCLMAANRPLNIVTSNAPVALYACLRGTPIVDVKFIGTELDRHGAILRFHEASREIVNYCRTVIERCDFVVQGACHVSPTHGICATSDFQQLADIRRHQVLAIRQVIIPSDWAKVAYANGHSFVTAEEFIANSDKITLVVPDPQKLGKISRADKMVYQRQLQQCIRETALRIIMTGSIRQCESK